MVASVVLQMDCIPRLIGFPAMTIRRRFAAPGYLFSATAPDARDPTERTIDRIIYATGRREAIAPDAARMEPNNGALDLRPRQDDPAFLAMIAA